MTGHPAGHATTQMVEATQRDVLLKADAVANHTLRA